MACCGGLSMTRLRRLDAAVFYSAFDAFVFVPRLLMINTDHRPKDLCLFARVIINKIYGIYRIYSSEAVRMTIRYIYPRCDRCRLTTIVGAQSLARFWGATFDAMVLPSGGRQVN